MPLEHTPNPLPPNLVVFLRGRGVLWKQRIQVLGDLVQHTLHRPIVAVPLQVAQELALARRALSVTQDARHKMQDTRCKTQDKMQDTRQL